MPGVPGVPEHSPDSPAWLSILGASKGTLGAPKVARPPLTSNSIQSAASAPFWDLQRSLSLLLTVFASDKYTKGSSSSSSTAHHRRAVMLDHTKAPSPLTRCASGLGLLPSSAAAARPRRGAPLCCLGAAAAAAAAWVLPVLQFCLGAAVAASVVKGRCRCRCILVCRMSLAALPLDVLACIYSVLPAASIQSARQCCRALAAVPLPAAVARNSHACERVLQSIVRPRRWLCLSGLKSLELGFISSVQQLAQALAAPGCSMLQDLCVACLYGDLQQPLVNVIAAASPHLPHFEHLTLGSPRFDSGFTPSSPPLTFDWPSHAEYFGQLKTLKIFGDQDDLLPMHTPLKVVLRHPMPSLLSIQFQDVHHIVLSTSVFGPDTSLTLKNPHPFKDVGLVVHSIPEPGNPANLIRVLDRPVAAFRAGQPWHCRMKLTTVFTASPPQRPIHMRVCNEQWSGPFSSILAATLPSFQFTE